MSSERASRASSPLVQRTCFHVPGRLVPTAATHRHRLAEPAATALATLIPLLGCGEEAAAIAFDGLSRTRNLKASAALRAIALEERDHDALMRQLAAMLPERANQRAMMRAARRFHIDLGRGGATMHLARIAGLDAAVCTVLSRLTRLGAPLRADSFIASTLIRIRNDEARHVAISRRLAVDGGANRDLRTAAADARTALAGILMLAADAFEALGVDPDQLDRDVTRLPNGLLST